MRKITVLIMLSAFVLGGWLYAQETEKPVQTEEKNTLELKTKIEKLIKQLGAENWKIRDEAQEGLVKIGQPVLFPLIDVLGSNDPEVVLRAKNVLFQLKPELNYDEITQLKEKLDTAKDSAKDILQKIWDNWWLEGGIPVDGLQLAIRSDKKVYSMKFKERINIEFRLKNMGEKDIYVCKDFHFNQAQYTYEITGPEGRVESIEVVPCPGDHALVLDDFQMLGKKESYKKKWESMFRNSRFSFFARWGNRRCWGLSKPGNYQIKMKYLNKIDGKKFGFKAWTGEITSNAITIELKEE